MLSEKMQSFAAKLARSNARNLQINSSTGYAVATYPAENVSNKVIETTQSLLEKLSGSGEYVTVSRAGKKYGLIKVNESQSGKSIIFVYKSINDDILSDDILDLGSNEVNEDDLPV